MRVKDIILKIKNSTVSAKRDRLLTSNTGYSIKSWFIYEAARYGFLLISVVSAVLVFDLAIDGKVDSDISGLAEIITAVAALWGAASIAKGVGEISEKVSKRKEDKENMNQ